jgi:hypothetical protein
MQKSGTFLVPLFFVFTTKIKYFYSVKSQNNSSIMKIEFTLNWLHLAAIINVIIALIGSIIYWTKSVAHGNDNKLVRLFSIIFILMYYLWPIVLLSNFIIFLRKKYLKFDYTYIAVTLWFWIWFYKKNKIELYRQFVNEHFPEAQKNTWQYKSVMKAFEFYKI